MIRIVVIGRPTPQGSKKFVGMMTSKKTGRQFGAMAEQTGKYLKPWRGAVKSAAKLIALGETGPRAPIDAPVRLKMVFTMPKPASAPKSRRTYPMRMPDLSKLARSTEDALTDAGIWADDARVVEYSRLAKVYPGEDPDALQCPGVLIEIETIDD